MNTPTVSIVLATRNRCPFPIGSALEVFNPLRMCLLTLAEQRVSESLEIVVVDDASTDGTSDVIASLRCVFEPAGIPLRHLRIATRLGPALARRAGTQVARGEIVVFMDDDCLLPPACVAGAVAALRNGVARRVAMVGLPCYYRTLRPTGCCAADRIGRLFLLEARWESNFDRLPARWLVDADNSDAHWWGHTPLWTSWPPRCLDVDWCLTGCAVAWRDVILQAQVFSEYLQTAWWAEALEVSVAIGRAGYRVCFTPEHALGVCHLKFGTRGRYQIHENDRNLRLPGLPMPFGEILAVAEEERPGSGIRTSPKDFFYNEILGYFAFLLRCDTEAANTWALREYERFVVEKYVHHRSIRDAPEKKSERYKIWQAAILGGLACYAQHLPDSPADSIGASLRSLLNGNISL
jgi:glycosyltransferase involved in cell wall biosynthesis